MNLPLHFDLRHSLTWWDSYHCSKIGYFFLSNKSTDSHFCYWRKTLHETTLGLNFKLSLGLSEMDCVQRLAITSFPQTRSKGWRYKQLSIQPMDESPVMSLLWGPRTVSTVLASPCFWTLVWTQHTCRSGLRLRALTATDGIQIQLDLGTMDSVLNFSEAQSFDCEMGEITTTSECSRLQTVMCT